MPANDAPSSRTSSIGSAASAAEHKQHVANNAALRGATLAFGRQPPRPHAKPKSIGAGAGAGAGSHGAMAAATSAGLRGGGVGAEHSPSRALTPSPPGSSGQSTSAAVPTRPTVSPQRSIPSGKGHQDRRAVQPPAPSQSHQAAVLAAARAKPTAPTNPAHQTARKTERPAVKPKPRQYSDDHAAELMDKPTDSTPTAPTTSLVHLFEKRSRAAASSPDKAQPALIKPSQDLPLKSPKPVRSGGITSMIQLELEQRNANENTDRMPEQDNLPVNQQNGPGHPSPGDRLKSHTDTKRRPPPSPSPQRPNDTQPIPIRQLPSPRPMSAQSTGMSISSMHSHRSITAQFNAANPRRSTPLRTGDQLANALVASSLASSRAPSPTRLEPPPVPTRRRKGHGSKFSFSRTPSPTKNGMLQTLRKQDSSSSSDTEEDNHPYKKHHKRRLVRKHPHKHHEGDRKRWRDIVTERERKRYEGVWAANRGLYCSFTPEEQKLIRTHPASSRASDIKAAINDSVSNIVVRDLWQRSRLPGNVLELVWSLVDNDRIGRLCREEFVVGMWLIDQRLKGRKLPSKVSDSVWTSVRSIGLRVRK
ncbi:hypothetical protein CERZMDRAFT_93844 [Cercospora zeae-maydis SCOH1-5]|uniref:EH domain-containing protein n=1 Tax=Cercospora zeae-maydis SCOH1-5 TaxID=717836 RepID=A0A6A6FTD2_9PEZI|nr:hypothetical protein CERZMDRAFT_93844 [Cercospora zeae-maydis SCOH1-5]